MPVNGGAPGRAEAVRGFLSALPPLAVFALFAWISADRWVVPFQDHGREVMTAWRLFSGERLYAEVASYYGPLPAFLDALALHLFGASLGSLVAVRVLFGVLGVEAVRRLATRLGADAPASGAIAAAVVAIAFFRLPGPAPFPYSVAALEGVVATFWALELALGCRDLRGALAAGALAGLAAGTKVDLLPAALLGPALALLLRRPKREALAALGVAGLLAALAWGLPVALVGAETLRSHGFLIAFADLPSWRAVYESIAFGGMTPGAFLRGGFLEVLFPSAPYLVCCGVVLWAARWNDRVAAVAAFALGLASAAVDGNGTLHSLLLLAWAAAGLALVAALRARGRLPDDALLVSGLAVCASMAPLLARQPFFLRMGSYLLPAAPLALVVALCLAARHLPRPGRLALFLWGVVAAQAAGRWEEYRGRPLESFESARARILVPPEEARFLREAVAAIERWSKPGDFVGGLPEAGFLLFVSGRRSPFVDELFYPGNQDRRAEGEMIAALETKPVRLVLVLDRPFPEYGPGEYGKGVLDRFFAALEVSFVKVGTVGSDAPGALPSRRSARRAEIYAPIGARPGGP